MGLLAPIATENRTAGWTQTAIEATLITRYVLLAVGSTLQGLCQVIVPSEHSYITVTTAPPKSGYHVLCDNSVELLII